MALMVQSSEGLKPRALVCLLVAPDSGLAIEVNRLSGVNLYLLLRDWMVAWAS